MEDGPSQQFDVFMRDADDDTSSEDEDNLDLPVDPAEDEEQEYRGKKQAVLVSGSPPTLINTPPATLESVKPLTNKQSERRRSLVLGVGGSGSVEPTADLARLFQAPSESSKSALVDGRHIRALNTGKAQGLEDGRHVGGLSLPQGRPRAFLGDELPLRTPTLGRSRSLPDFMEVEFNDLKKSQKSSGNSSPRSAMRDWDEDSPNGIHLMLPSPRDELRNFIVAHQVADCKAEGLLHLSGTVPIDVMQAERDRKRPNTDPGSRRQKPGGEGLDTTPEEDAAAHEIATAFKEWVRF